MTADELASKVGFEAGRELAAAHDKIKHCLAQLTDEQVWHRSRPSSNSIGNLLLHLCGNLRQWIVSGLGGTNDVRDRPGEFSQRTPIAKQELLKTLDGVVEEATTELARMTASELLRVRRVQGFDETGLAVIFSSVPHFRGHTQEIVSMTRLQLGDAFRFAWAPMTPEQGTPGPE